MNDLRQTKEYATFLETIGWEVRRLHSRNYFLKRIPLLGWAIKLQRVDSILFEDLDKLCKKFRVFQIIYEPNKITAKEKIALSQKGFNLTKLPYLPTKTLQIDLTQSKDKILKNMKKDARYSIRKSTEIIVHESQDVETFRLAWKEAVGNKRHVLPIHELQAFKMSFKNNMTIIMNKFQTSGAMFLIADGVCYYWVGFTDEFARKSLVQYQVLWQGIKWAKKRKAKIFDFEGIYDDRFPKSEWKGFTHFKKSFGGKEVEYPGCYTKWRIPF